MTNTVARIKREGKHFEIIVDLDNALKFKKGEITTIEAGNDKIFSDSRKGEAASDADLRKAFGTTDTNLIVEKIIKSGEVLLTQEHRDEEKEKKFKQVVDFLARNAIDPKTRNPHSPERIKSALEEAHINLKNVPIENQIKDIILGISRILPIRLETKKVRINIPAVHTGKAYGIVSQYKENEEWLGDGSLEIVVSVPAGLVMDFYDKLNSVTHGSALTEEIREDD